MSHRTKDYPSTDYDVTKKRSHLSTMSFKMGNIFPLRIDDAGARILLVLGGIIVLAITALLPALILYFVWNEGLKALVKDHDRWNLREKISFRQAFMSVFLISMIRPSVLQITQHITAPIHSF